MYFSLATERVSMEIRIVILRDRKKAKAVSIREDKKVEFKSQGCSLENYCKAMKIIFKDRN